MIRIEYILLHSDGNFPAEAEFSEVFMPSFWRDMDQLMVDGDQSVQFDDSGKWNFLELDLLDEQRSSLAVFRVDAVRESNYPSTARYSEVNVDELLQNLRSGRYSGFSETRSMEGWCFTSLHLETDDVRLRKEFYASVNRFLQKTNAIVVYPELMSADAFRSFHSLVQDKVEPEVEPIDEED